MLVRDAEDQVAKLEAILAAGATSVSVDGQSVSYDFASIRRRVRQLKHYIELHREGAVKTRPVAARIDLAGF